MENDTRSVPQKESIWETGEYIYIYVNIDHFIAKVATSPSLRPAVNHYKTLDDQQNSELYTVHSETKYT